MVRKKIDATLFEMCLGIFLYGVVFQLILLCFSRNLSYSIGLWIGIVLAGAGAVHMWWTLSRGMDLAQKDASIRIGTGSILRYLVLIAVMVGLYVTDACNPFFVFGGYMGLKVAAYLNPLMKKLNDAFFRIGR